MLVRLRRHRRRRQLTPTPTATATPIATPCGPNLIADSTFEAGTPWPNWTVQTSTNFGTPLCNTAACGTDAGTAPPYAGDNWAWFGGANVAETATLGQSVVIPAGGQATLNFLHADRGSFCPFYRRPERKSGWHHRAELSGATTTRVAYSLRTIDLSAFADGASHLMLFEYIAPTTGKSNYVVDNVTLNIGNCSTPSLPPLRQQRQLQQQPLLRLRQRRHRDRHRHGYGHRHHDLHSGQLMDQPVSLSHRRLGKRRGLTRWQHL